MKKSPPDKFVVSNLTDVGMVRESNQDYYGKYSGHFGDLIIVCDGIGGYAGGEVASQSAVASIAAHFQSLGPIYDETDALHRALSMAQQDIARQAGENAELADMGTTAVALLIREFQYWIAWIGDSRIYRRRGGSTEQLSTDHSWVQEMVDQGLIKPEDAKDHPRKNIILRSLEAKSYPADVRGPFPLYRGDVFMLCSDGLSDYFTLDEVNKYLAEEPQYVCQAMVDEAKRRGGKDNITIQVLKMLQGPVYKKPPGKKSINLVTLVLALLALGLLLFGGFNFLGKYNKLKKMQQPLSDTVVSKPKPPEPTNDDENEDANDNKPNVTGTSNPTRTSQRSNRNVNPGGAQVTSGPAGGSATTTGSAPTPDEPGAGLPATNTEPPGTDTGESEGR